MSARLDELWQLIDERIERLQEQADRVSNRDSYNCGFIEGALHELRKLRLLADREV